MISIFGIVSVVIALISVAIIVLHNRVMAKRTPVDTYLAELEDMLRDRIENLYHASHPDSELRDLCGQCVDLDLSNMLKALPDIDRACAAGSHIDEHAHPQGMGETIKALNQAIEEYNRFITGNLPVVLMAQALGLKVEEPV